ncbi:DUF4815 domain-containing protein [Leptospira interrogans]
MAHEHPSGVSGAWDRAPANPNWARVVVREDRLGQAAEINEAQTIIERRTQRVGNMVAKDGDRVDGAGIAIVRDDEESETGTIFLTAGSIYVRGDVRPIAAVSMTEVDLTGDIIVGVRLSATVVTEDEDVTLLGLEPGTEAEGEPGAARVIETIAWALSDDDGEGDFFSVYLVRNGDIIDQTPPPNLSGINQAIALYDRDANGNYIVEGCRVTALGKISSDQVFSIEEGVANIRGFKRTRFAATRFPVLEEWDLGTVSAEPHTFADGGGGTATIQLNRGPIHAITSVIVTKEVTQTFVRGTPNNTSDALAHSGVTEILEVKQGGTTYVEDTDYVLSGDHISWAPGGDEPSGGSSYDVKYRYLDVVSPDAVDATSVTISGGVTGTAVLVAYTWKLARIDLVCLNESGEAVYLKGGSVRERPVPPIAPSSLLPLAEITNTWVGKPTVLNNGVRAYPYTKIDRMYNKLFDALALVSEERLRRDIDSREPVAKRGVFVDPFTSDRYRDAGEAQTAAVFGGSCQLAIDPTFVRPDIDGPITLDWTEEVVVAQELVTACMPINPYQNFTPLPARLTIDPPVDFWTETATQWTSPATESFGTGNSSRTTVNDVLLDQRQEQLEFLRQIEVDFFIEGFGAGEVLDSLTFDDIDVTPGGTPTADSDGEIAGTFTIPANVVAGQKLVVADGQGGSHAEAVFVGQGIISIEVMQRVTTTTNSQRNIRLVTVAADPLSQTFALPEPRHIAGFDIRVCAIGDASKPCLLELVTVDNGMPTTDIIASQLIPMGDVEVGDWVEVRFNMPVFLPADRQFAFVVKTDDPVHGLSIARLGDFDAIAQRYVSAQPYTVGVLLSSSNAITWTPHQEADLAFRVVAAKFAPTTKTVDLGTHEIVNVSDLLVRAAIDLPTDAATLHFEIERPSGEVIRLSPGQVFEFTSFITEEIEFRAVLNGTEKISPTLFPGVALILGTIRTSGTYVSRAFKMGTAIRLSVIVNSKLPAGSSLTVEVDAADDDFDSVDLNTSTPLNDGWIEQEYRIDEFTAQDGRIRLTLTGGPGARPSLYDLRAVSI